MLKDAFGALARLHSRSATLKRLGPVAIYSPVRITPSNYFRFLRGPEYTTIAGREFIIPIGTMLGQFSQNLVFSKTPDMGWYRLTWNIVDTEILDYDATTVEIQAALRLIPGLENILVSGNYIDGLVFTFVGFYEAPSMISVTDSTLEDALDEPVTQTITAGNVPWDDPIKRGDRIIEGTRIYTVDEIMEMPDFGGTTMGFRCRCD